MTIYLSTLLAGALALGFGATIASAADIVDTAVAGKPTDEAFAKLPAGTLETLLQPENKAKLRSILLYHVVPGQVMAEEVVKLDAAKTAEGQSVAIKVVSGNVMVNNAHVTKTDITTSNGVIHVIDTVLLPK